MRKIKDPDFGYSSKRNTQSIINDKGESTIIHENRTFSFQDTYSYLVQVSWSKFFLLVFLSYLVLNIVFGIVYTIIGIEELTIGTGNLFKDFLNGFFFSAQTVTTVGYGGISPNGLFANIVSSFEALIGLLSFSFITGLLYGRFSKPKASISFSENIIIRDIEGGRALMFRLMNNRTSIMIEPEISLSMAITKENEILLSNRKFYDLSLERDHLKYLATTWTIVHEIREESPLFNLTNEEIKALDVEWYILIQYLEDSFSQRVYQVHSYTENALKFDLKFEPSAYYNNEGFAVFDHGKLSNLVPLED